MDSSITEVVDALRASLLENERLRQQNQRLTTASSEPLAIVGIGCRYPGGVHDVEGLWQLITDGRDAMTGFPADRGWERWDVPTARTGAFLHDAGDFDPDFFRISPREAKAMDPQQRLLLETSWEALERAGIDPASLKGSRTGVFVGGAPQEYGALVMNSAEGAGGYALTGAPGSVLSGRISYALGLEGPAVTVDTACSSSLVALHLAIKSLRTGECDLALAGGVLVLVTPSIFAEFAATGGSAGDGRCKAFSADADGTGWGEGAGVLAIQRLSDARRDGNPVLAVIRGSAANQDGASNGLSAPNGPSQQRVIRQALANAGLSPADVDMVEAHGTGTTLGDPIEAEALLATYGQDRPADRPLWLGTLKSNIGHTQAAAGVSGVIKAVLALQHGVLPQTLHVQEPTPEVDWSSGAVELLTEARPWPETGRPRRAGVSSFGISGTNAHVILEQAPEDEPAEPAADAGRPALGGPVPWVVSGRNAAALRDQAARLAAHLARTPGLDPTDVGLSLAGTRSAFEHRAVVLGGDPDTLVAGLRSVADGAEGTGVVSGRTSTGGAVFVFPGQGSQWVGMAAELADASPAFRARLTECEAALSPLVDWSLLAVLRQEPGAPSFDRVDVVQPVLWAVMVSLAAVWRSFGVEPAAVIGHSQGEVAAACVAGGLSLEDGARIVVVRSRLVLEKLSGKGGMVSVSLPVAEAEERIAAFDGRIGVAAVNGPASVVVSGEPDALDELLASCEAEGVRARRIAVDYASHSAQVDALNEDLLRELAGIRPQSSSVAFYSTVSGERMDTAGLDAGYWVRNLRERVQFEPVTRLLAEKGNSLFIEASPHPVLTMAVAQTGDAVERALVTVGSLRREEGGAERFLTSLAEAYVAGAPVDWKQLFPSGNRVPLPTYAFQHQRYWIDDAVIPGQGTAVDPVDAAFWGAVERADAAGVAELVDGGAVGAWEPVVPALSAWRRGRRERSVLDTWRYRTVWRSVTVPSSGRLSGAWLLVTPGGAAPVGEVRGALVAAGAEVTVLETGAGLDRAALAVRLAETPDVQGVVSLLGWDEEAGAERTVALVQAHVDTTAVAPLWVLTRGAASVGADDVVRPMQTQLWALGQVAGLEQPGVWGGLVDVPAVWDERVAAGFVGVLAAGGGEDQVAVRSSGAYARRLVRAPLGGSSVPVREWSPRGTVLVTGGTGGIGAHLARWLAKDGAEHLVLLSRRGEAAGGAAELAAELRGLGAGVSVVACDVTDRDALAEVIKAVPAEHPLTAVFHTAGISGYAELALATPEHFAEILSARLHGARNLDEITAELGVELDAFVVFSSGAAVWGSASNGANAAAGAFLDGLARERRARGLTATSVSWGGWQGTAMAEGDTAEQLLRRGVRLLDPAQATLALRQALEQDETSLTVTDMDWELFTPGYTMARRRPLIEDIPEVGLALDKTAAGGDVLDPTGVGLRETLAGTAEPERGALLLELVRGEAAQVLSHGSTAEITAGRPFRDLGFDSLTAMDLRNRLNRATGLRLPATLVFDYPTPNQLATHLHAELTGGPAAVGAVVPAGRAADDEPLAIVGMACRYPGGVRGAGDLWQLVVENRDELTEFPTDRGWERWGAPTVGRAGFLHEAGEFDAGFFGISPREAAAMDPQQRLLLETSWEAVEHAGIDPWSLRNSATGVFVGGGPQDYPTVLMNSAEADSGYGMTGALGSVMSGRVSYVLGLEGPAVTVDTACSSSLVALHLAAQSLRNGECDMALAGGVTIMATPGAFAEFDTLGGMAGDGRCKAFSSDADGTGWGEGVGMIVVERLSDARRNGHEVLAVLRGSAINQDGASNGLSAPNGPSQQRVIRQALANAGLSAADVDMVEAHGTGTTLGDPIEAQALLATYGQDRPADQPLWLGSVKSNFGHTGAAAGVAGVIKSVLALREGLLPKTLHVQEPTPEVDWSAGAVELLTENRAWPETGRPRRAGVSSFGISGTNAHVILEQAPEAEPAEPAEPAADAGRPALGGPVPWVVSGRNAAALRDQAARLAAHLSQNPGTTPLDIGHALTTTRSAFDERAVVVGSTTDELLHGLRSIADGTNAPTVVSGRASASSASGVVFVFPGQGSQWVGMGRELWDASPVFAESMVACERALSPLVDWSLRDVVFREADDPLWGRVDVVQPVLWAVMVSLAAVWRSFGVEPAAVIGHSQGEVAAACVAGGLSLEDGARVAAVRSRLVLEKLSGKGGMVSVSLPVTDVEERIAAFEGRIGVAAVNGPASVVVSGEPEALDVLLASCEAEGVRARRIAVDYASHSAQVDVLNEDLLRELADIRPTSSSVAFYSTVSGERMDTAGLDAGYWVRNLRERVQFEPVTRLLVEKGHAFFVESSPHPVLTMAVAQTGDAVERVLVTVGSLRREEGGAERFLTSLAEAYVAGAPVDWKQLFPSGSRVSLPTYAFQHQRYWLEDAVAPSADGAVDPVDAAFWGAVERADVAGIAELVAGADADSWAPVLSALSSWRKGRQEQSTLDSWRYRTVWRSVTVPSSGRLSGAWLVVSAGGAAPVEEVRDALAAAGAQVTVLETEAGLDRAALAARLAETPDVAGLVSLLGWDEEVGTSATVTWVQAVAAAGLEAPLWVLTRGAAAVGADDVVRPAQTQLWALGQIVGLEQPGVWGGLVDVPPVWDERVAAGFTGVLAAGGGEDQVAVRSSGAYARRLVRAPLGASPVPVREWSPRGTVLVTGGTGGIGAHLARWLAKDGAEHLVLLSRRGEAAGGAAELAAELRGLGAGVSVVACDVTDRDALAEVIKAVPAEHPLTAVFHTAGVASYGTVGQLELAELETQMAAKTLGGRHLDDLTTELGIELDAFVLFSSGAAVWGSAGNGGYAASNAYLDGLARQRRARGLTATSVSWGGWKATGMATDGTAEQLSRRGVRAMDPALAIEALRQAIEQDETALTVTDMDWERFTPGYTMARRRPLIEDIPEVARVLSEDSAAPSSDDTVGSALRAELAGLSGSEQLSVLLDLVRREVARILAHSSTAEITAEKPFKDLGFDSLTAMELRNLLTAATGLKLPATLVFDYPNPQQLAAHLVAELLGAGTDLASSPATVRAVTTDEPLAIVGMACRYAGGVASPEDLWRVVVEQREGMSEFPSYRGWDRWNISSVRPSGFLHEAGDFDAGFFGISPREATAMDPQQRLLLETSWEAIERTGIDPQSLRGSDTGVFVGGTAVEYGALLMNSPASQGYAVTGSSGSVMSGRVSYVLGLEGPAVSVDTACSSSLVALHLAAQSLRTGECDLALTGGVGLMATPGAFAEFDTLGGMSVDGRTKAFAAAADGIGWGEGVGMIVLERLSDARRNGHEVLAVIQGSAINQDGASNGLSAPNGPSQQRVIRQALANAGLSAADVDMVEAHGTGTTLGDPIEAQALLATYGQDRPADQPLWLGSVKTNIGHTGAAAGVAGVIKSVLALREGLLPKTLNVDEPTPKVDWASGAVELLTEERPWPELGRPRRAGVSSFGVSGTNAHVILEQAPEDTPDALDAPAAVEPPALPALVSPIVPWVFSGRSSAALRGQAARLAALAEREPDLAVTDVAHALVTTRARLEHRAVVLGGSLSDLADGLHAVTAGESSTRVTSGAATAGDRVVFVFPGQGSQWVGMGRELWDASPVFAESMVACERALSPLVDWSLRDVVFREADDPLWGRVDVVQPVLWAVMVSLAAVWRSFGVEPAAVIGHSQGEVAAACVAGGLSLEDGARVAAVRSRLVLEKLSGKGGMVSVSLPVTDVEERIAGFEGRIGVAAVNGPASVVVSGEPEALDVLLASCEAEGVRARRIAVDYASHSAQVDVLNEDLLRELADIRPQSSSVAFYSTVSGERMDTAGLDAGYWVRNLRERVQFEPVTRLLVEKGHAFFVESSPHPVLTMAVAQTGDAVERVLVTVGSLRREEGGAERFLTSLAEAYVAGAPVDWKQLFPSGSRVSLPTYAFQHQRYWLEGVTIGAQVVETADTAESEFWNAVERQDLAGLTAVLDGAGAVGVDPAAGADAWLPVLSAWRKGRREQSVLDSWRYRTEWRATGLPSEPRLSGVWLLVTPGGAAPVEEVRDALVAAGAEVTVLEVEAGLDRAALAARLAETPDVQGVVSLLGWDEEAGAERTVALVQAHVDTTAVAPLWVLTRGAASVGSADPVSPVQTQLWALGQVAGLEQPGVWGGLVDVPAVWDERVAAGFVGVLAAGGGEDQVAVRSSGAYARRLVRAPLGGSPVPVREWSPRGTVLVTGGTGGIGAHLARWLAKDGAEHLVLLSRRGEAAGGAAELAAELRGLGAGVSVVACDVTDRDALAEVIKAVPAEHPLTAVFHTAGIAGHGPLDELETAGLAGQLSARTRGARNLDEITAELGVELDAFVVFSSGAAVWGSASNGANAAAGAFLDGLARERRARGLTATSVSWGGWQGTAMARDGNAEQLLRRGVRLLDPAQATLALRQALEQDETSLTVTDMDWERFTPGYTMARRRPLIEDIPEVGRVLGDAGDTAQTPEDATAGADLQARLAGLTDGEQHAQLLSLVRGEAAQVLAHASTADITPNRPFQELGFDSLTAMDLRNRLNRATGLRLPATLVFDHPNPQRLTSHLLAELAKGGEAALSDVLDIRRELARIGQALDSVAPDPQAREDIADHLRDLMAKLGSTERDSTTDLEAATDDEIFDFIDRDLGVS